MPPPIDFRFVIISLRMLLHFCDATKAAGIMPFVGKAAFQ
jgi:hypothetical protein